MKYLYVIANAFTAMTGGDRHFIEIAKRCSDIKGLEVVLVAPAAVEDICRREGLQTKFIAVCPNEIGMLGIVGTYTLRILSILFKIHNFKKNAIIYSTSDCFTDVFPALIFKILRRDSKWVSCSFHLVSHYSVRQGSIVKNILSYYSQRLSIFFMKLADLIVVDNNVLKGELNALGIHTEKVFVSSMGVDTDYINGIKYGAENYDGCFVGRLHPAKGVYDLIEIWRNVVNIKKDAKLAVIGKGGQEIVNILKNKIRDCKLDDNIILLGFLDEKRMYEIVKGSKVFLFPSHEEGWGIAIAEAMACGLPAVIYDLPALREVFPEGAVRVGFGDTDSFAKQVILLLSDEQRYMRLKKEAEHIVNNYNWNNVAKKELEKICEICNET